MYDILSDSILKTSLYLAQIEGLHTEKSEHFIRVVTYFGNLIMSDLPAFIFFNFRSKLGET